MSTPLVVVSGLPRSGTSLMMAALAAGGLPVLTDQKRPPDEHNPRGYYEDERVLKLARDASWLRGHEGKAVKILSHLLTSIPTDVPAKVLFMRRPLEEVIASQNAMLGAREPAESWRALLERDLASTLRWLESQTHLQVVQVGYRRILEQPLEQFTKVRDFLGLSLDVEAMAACVDPSLYRQRG